MKTRLAVLVALIAPCAFAATPEVSGVVNTAPFVSYDDAPATVDADDPAIWVHPERPADSLVIGTLKDAGLVVYDLRGKVLQVIAPPNLPTILAEDPPTPAGVNLSPPQPCTGSDGSTFGRFNNVDVAYNVKLAKGRRDIAVVTDRGCDRLRIYAIDRDSPHGPLIDITATRAPRLFPWRVVQPSPVQPATLPAGLQSNPIDEQDTGYGVGLWNTHDAVYAFVSQRNRSVVQQVELVAERNGTVSYRPVRVFLFNPNFRLKAPGARAFNWTPCRENANEDPQSEGILVDPASDTLYVAFETIGVYRIPLKRSLPVAVRVGREYLLDPVKNFGKPYWAVPDEDEFSCESEQPSETGDDVLTAEGSDAFAGQHLEADVEGLAFYETGKRGGYLVVSSQGDNTFHLYERGGSNCHLVTFAVTDTEDSDGVAITNSSLGRAFPDGLVVVQNGAASDPENTDDINGYEYDGSTQFRFVDWRAIVRATGLR